MVVKKNPIIYSGFSSNGHDNHGGNGEGNRNDPIYNLNMRLSKVEVEIQSLTKKVDNLEVKLDSVAKIASNISPNMLKWFIGMFITIIGIALAFANYHFAAINKVVDSKFDVIYYRLLTTIHDTETPATEKPNIQDSEPQ